MIQEWDARYAEKAYVYGTNPNQYFKQVISTLEPVGSLLLPAEGEGRNAVFAAQKGWEVFAFDQSYVAKEKALNLAASAAVHINYTIQSLDTWQAIPESYDVIAFIFVHLPQLLRLQVHDKAIQSLKKGGTLILQAFSTAQLTNKSGGPKNINLLYTTNLLEQDFKNLHILECKEEQIMLNEGNLHQGIANVISLTAIKI